MPPSVRYSYTTSALPRPDCGRAGELFSTCTSAPAPALVQVENSSPARPQSGLGSADVVYEYLTEGGISRFSAIYLHAAAGRIGPIRSARLVSITLTRLYGAV